VQDTQLERLEDESLPVVLDPAMTLDEKRQQIARWATTAASGRFPLHRRICSFYFCLPQLHALHILVERRWPLSASFTA